MTVDKRDQNNRKTFRCRENKINWISTWNHEGRAYRKKNEKMARTENWMNEVLHLCKEDVRSFNLAGEVRRTLNNKNNEKEQKQMSWNKLLIHQQMCQEDQRENPTLCKFNSMTVTQMMTDIGKMLSSNHDKDIGDVFHFLDEVAMLNKSWTKTSVKK